MLCLAPGGELPQRLAALSVKGKEGLSQDRALLLLLSPTCEAVQYCHDLSQSILRFHYAWREANIELRLGLPWEAVHELRPPFFLWGCL